MLSNLTRSLPYQYQVPRKKNEEILREVATVISESHTDVMKRLGKEMGFKSKDIKKYRKANRAEDEAKSEGALEMLQSWSKDVPADRVPTDLKETLTKANLTWVPVEQSAVEDPGTAPSSVDIQSSGIKVALSQ